MSSHMRNSVEEDLEELPATNTGPKGVINDWRRFKLESEDHESIPPNKRELLRQMSSPYRPPKGDEKELRERLNRKMSIQEYELIQDEDEKSLRKYRKQCMQEMHQRLSFGPRFGCLYDLESGEQFLEVIEKEHRLTIVVVHIYEDEVKGCDALNKCLSCLATEYPSVKFCKIKASNTGAGDRFSDGVLPTLLVYKAGELVGNFLSITEHLNEEFFAVDVECFLNEYGLLPEKEFGACQNTGSEDDADVE
ncbi:phosducin b [Erpetoichthys calabaricus]|uniref:phosducin b n=1 Tax=Erpetoichthys calabaricus TaxID=27687 RepID=UPI002233F6B7|nr:phosducin b [Erpetoichthys calabaricus]